MAELKTKVNKKSVAKFLAKIEDEQVRKDCKAIAAMMKKATGKKAEMWGPGIIGFGRLRYKGKSGTSGEWMEAAFAPRKGVITMYIMSGFAPHKPLLKKLGKHKTGMGCLYVKRLSDVDVPTLNKIIVNSVKRVRQHGILGAS